MLAAELTETTRLYARCAARIEPEWIEQVAGDLVDKTWFDPRWDEERGEVVASERVALYGLTLVPAAGSSYGAIDPGRARGYSSAGAGCGCARGRARFWSTTGR